MGDQILHSDISKYRWLRCHSEPSHHRNSTTQIYIQNVNKTLLPTMRDYSSCYQHHMLYASVHYIRVFKQQRWWCFEAEQRPTRAVAPVVIALSYPTIPIAANSFISQMLKRAVNHSGLNWLRLETKTFRMPSSISPAVYTVVKV